MVWIKMLCTCKATEDGYIVREFYSGFEYDVCETLARKFLFTDTAVKVFVQKNKITG